MASTYSLPSDYTEDNPFTKKEMSLFVVIYTFCVILLIIMYEHLMPVINNPTYPHYNKVPSFEFVSGAQTTTPGF
ncbi:Protein CBG04244 [Caenorhabditis briggsae]|uniref:Uncharacterized protein n=3 Tax=Caenorhabditis TaxID=6237 RepID=A0AAE9E9R4_CAEBR|nr:Protein CBG04244 [Caenorhabditis briggsae]PIC44802.1 hypothetical protein B9Z55_005048 [Caenorhabditis nigoni]ULU04773.1 hypothetical protein L3Y34_017492 [Caenorhabditis briggsae]UMM16761.1 hypothetical protein L5515_013634 [Caenorhabditis briggsae]CAP24990.1 Protein CBG04244 [Caenorhabditis briggsae]